MNKRKKPHNKPGIVFENFLTGKFTCTPKMIEGIQTSRAEDLEEAICPADDVSFADSARGGN